MVSEGDTLERRMADLVAGVAELRRSLRTSLFYLETRRPARAAPHLRGASLAARQLSQSSAAIAAEVDHRTPA